MIVEAPKFTVKHLGKSGPAASSSAPDSPDRPSVVALGSESGKLQLPLATMTARYLSHLSGGVKETRNIFDP